MSQRLSVLLRIELIVFLAFFDLKLPKSDKFGTVNEEPLVRWLTCQWLLICPLLLWNFLLRELFHFYQGVICFCLGKNILYICITATYKTHTFHVIFSNCIFYPYNFRHGFDFICNVTGTRVNNHHSYFFSGNRSYLGSKVFCSCTRMACNYNWTDREISRPFIYFIMESPMITISSGVLLSLTSSWSDSNDFWLHLLSFCFLEVTLVLFLIFLIIYWWLCHSLFAKSKRKIDV